MWQRHDRLDTPAADRGVPISVAEVDSMRASVVGVGFPSPDGPRARSAGVVSAAIPV